MVIIAGNEPTDLSTEKKLKSKLSSVRYKLREDNGTQPQKRKKEPSWLLNWYFPVEYPYSKLIFVFLDLNFS